MIPALARLGDRVYLPVAADGDPRHASRAGGPETTVVEAQPEPWFAVRVEIVAGNGARAAAEQPLAIGYERQQPSAARYPERSDEDARPESAVLAPAVASSQASLASAGRISPGDGWRAIAAYNALLDAHERDQSSRPGPRIHVRA